MLISLLVVIRTVLADTFAHAKPGTACSFVSPPKHLRHADMPRRPNYERALNPGSYVHAHRALRPLRRAQQDRRARNKTWHEPVTKPPGTPDRPTDRELWGPITLHPETHFQI
jgi:hypothetical protein